jgi:hypothetical protein
VVDVAAWDSTSVPSAWMVGNLSSRFAATGGAFTVGTGELELGMTGAPWDRATRPGSRGGRWGLGLRGEPGADGPGDATPR